MAEKKGNTMSFFWMIILVILIAAGTSYAFMSFFNPDRSQQVVANVDKVGPTYSLGDFTVNLAGTGGYQYVKASIVVEVTTDDVAAELDKRSPQIRDAIISILRDQRGADIEEPGAGVLKNQIEVGLNQLLATGKVTNVWFTQLVVQ